MLYRDQPYTTTTTNWAAALHVLQLSGWQPPSHDSLPAAKANITHPQSLPSRLSTMASLHQFGPATINVGQRLCGYVSAAQSVSSFRAINSAIVILRSTHLSVFPFAELIFLLAQVYCRTSSRAQWLSVECEQARQVCSAKSAHPPCIKHLLTLKVLITAKVASI